MKHQINTDNLDPAELEMRITPEIENLMKGEPFFLEIEMLQGTRTELQDGRIEYKIQITDPAKKEMVVEFLLKMISNSHKAINN
jgi:hypothetical protein